MAATRRSRAIRFFRDLSALLGPRFHCAYNFEGLHAGMTVRIIRKSNGAELYRVWDRHMLYRLRNPYLFACVEAEGIVRAFWALDGEASQ